MINLTREEAQKVLDALNTVYGAPRYEASKILRARLSEPEPAGKYSDIVSDGGLDPRNKYDVQPEPEPVATDFIRRTNDDYVAWCKTYYQADALDEFGRASLHGLWAWQEQECRKAAPPQPEPEPVAYLWECLGRWSAMLANDGEHADLSPPSWLCDAVETATTPPQREWVGLTDEEIDEAWPSPEGTNSVRLVARIIEDKLREKNGA